MWLYDHFPQCSFFLTFRNYLYLPVYFEKAVESFVTATVDFKENTLKTLDQNR